MPASANESAVRVLVSPDKAKAELWICPGSDRGAITPAMCEALLRDAGVEVSAAARAAVEKALLTPADQQVRAIVARATPPQHGKDGYVEWLVETPAAQAEQAAECAVPAAGGRQNYYERCSYITVKAGDVVGKVHLPTPGQDGRDVMGLAIRAKAGKEYELQIDESLMRDASGKLIVQWDGVLAREPNKARVLRVLEVSGYVDFSTGNIDFHGDVIIGKGVRDLFTVKATGNVEVQGLIEAATIFAGNDLIAHGGFAGRERGVARCGGTIQAKYLDNVQGEVLRDLKIEREIINCDLTVHGNLAAVHGAVIGGRVTVTGTAHVGMLGSAAAVPTELVLGSVPRLEPLCQRLREFVDKLSTRLDQLLADQAQLTNLVGKKRATAADKERQTELSFEISNAQTLLGKARPTLAKLEERIAQQRTVDVTVERKLFPGVVLAVGDDRYRISKEVRGPMRITRDERGDIVVSTGTDQPRQLLQIASVQMAA